MADQQTSYPIEAILNKQGTQSTIESKEDTQTTRAQYQCPETPKEEEEHDHPGEDEGSKQDSEEELTQVIADQESSYPIEPVFNRRDAQPNTNSQDDTHATRTEYEQHEAILKEGRKRVREQTSLQESETAISRETQLHKEKHNR